MNQQLIGKLALVAGLAMCGAAVQAQNVIILNAPEATAAAARAAMQASMEGARRGERIGMITGQANPQAQRSPNGTVSLELDASTMMYSVARIGADGQIERLCVSSAEDAAKALSAPSFAPRMSPKNFPRAKEIVHASK